MLLRLISAISLLVFALQLMSGSAIEAALYRSLLVFLALFASIYLTLFFINIVQSSNTRRASTPAQTSGTGRAEPEPKTTRPE